MSLLMEGMVVLMVIDAVELYNTGSSTWSQITSLPQPLACPSAAICDNQLYVMAMDTLAPCKLFCPVINQSAHSR